MLALGFFSGFGGNKTGLRKININIRSFRRTRNKLSKIFYCDPLMLG